MRNNKETNLNTFVFSYYFILINKKENMISVNVFLVIV